MIHQIDVNYMKNILLNQKLIQFYNKILNYKNQPITSEPTFQPTKDPTNQPTSSDPTFQPTKDPSYAPFHYETTTYAPYPTYNYNPMTYAGGSFAPAPTYTYAPIQVSSDNLLF